MSNSYVVSHRANQDLKEVSITARDPERSGCQIINENGRYKLRWNWLNAKDRPDLNDWDISVAGLTRDEARKAKQTLIEWFVNLGYTIRTVKHYEDQ